MILLSKSPTKAKCFLYRLMAQPASNYSWRVLPILQATLAQRGRMFLEISVGDTEDDTINFRVPKTSDASYTGDSLQSCKHLFNQNSACCP